MKKTRLLMGMPITVSVIDTKVTPKDINTVFDYFIYVDQTFSTYKATSEISRINRGLVLENEYSKDMKTVFALSKQTKQETHGYFDIFHEGKYDPSGLVKGWAIQNASTILQEKGFQNFYIDAGGDIQAVGKNEKGRPWKVGIRNPFNRNENVKILEIENKAVATSGTYIRGQHIYNPHINDKLSTTNYQFTTEIVSVTVVGLNIYDADRFATAAFAMGVKGICFIESLADFEGYMIDKDGKATYTTGFEKYVI